MRFARSASGYRIEYDQARKAYVMQWPDPGTYKVVATFAVRATEIGDGMAQATFSVPSANVRSLEMESARTDMEVDLPEALRVERHVGDGKLVVRAVQGPSPERAGALEAAGPGDGYAPGVRQPDERDCDLQHRRTAAGRLGEL